MQQGDILADRYELIESVHSSWLACDQINDQLCLLKPAASFVDARVAEWLGTVWHAGLPRMLGRIMADEGPSCGMQSGAQDAAVAEIRLNTAEAQPVAADRDYYVFEYRQGRTLREIADEGHGRIGADCLLPLLSQAAAILAYLHQQGDQPIVHLDLKPEHILLEASGQVSLIDFGAARIVASVEPSESAGGTGSQAARVAGPYEERIALTPGYAAPEQRAGKPGPASDIFALSLVLLNLISGQPPAVCRGGMIEQLLPAASPSLLRLLGDCLMADPRRRLADARVLQDTLIGECEHQALLSARDESPACAAVQGAVANDSTVAAKPAVAALAADSTVVADFAVGAPPGAGSGDEPDQTADRNPAIKASQKPALSARQAATILCVWGGPEFGCELASIMAQRQDILVIDADPFCPQADLLLGSVDRQPPDRGDFAPGSLDLALACERRQELDAHSLNSLTEPTRVSRVRLLTTRLGLEHYEHLSLDSLHAVLRLAQLISDCVIVLCSSFVFDAFACLGLMQSDAILIPRPGDFGSLRACSRALDLLISHYELDPQKLHVVAFSYRSNSDLGRGTLDALCLGRLIGCISESARRRDMKTGARPYAAAIDRLNTSEYRTIIRKLHLAGSASGTSRPAQGKHKGGLKCR
jgi:serine/threonine protein kinase